MPSVTTMMPNTRLRIGVDVGGTFTDLIAFDPDSQILTHYKTPSTPHDPAQALLTGIQALLAQLDSRSAAVEYLGHGTTVATNMIIQRRGANTALVTTRGFRDVLEIARQTRPHLYDYRVRRAAPVIARAQRFEVDERVAANGDIVTALELEQVQALADTFADSAIEAVAICLLHSYRNGTHERQVLEILRQRLPHAYICASHEVLPEFREFERTSTTALNAYVGPQMQRYSQQLEALLRAQGVTAKPYTMQSNGGLMSPQQVQRYPIRTCLSGPAAGVMGAAHLANSAVAINTLTSADVLTFDVGGTSTDVALVLAGQATTTVEREVAGHPVRTPMLDVHVIGAGGGSIAEVDPAGGLKVGPASAGAVPGPIAYGQGGQRVTLTDANIVLGRISAQTRLAGRLSVDPQLAYDALQMQIATPLGISVEAAALGVVRVAVAHIARAIRGVAASRGLDITQLPLLAYGGAGPLHAVDVAREVQAQRVIIPPEPGTMCARGLLLTDVSTDLVRSVVAPLTPRVWSDVQQILDELTREGLLWLDSEGIAAQQQQVELTLDARYVGQSFEVAVSATDAGSLTHEQFVARFHAAHETLYGYAMLERATVLVNCRARVIGIVDKAHTAAHASETPRPAIAAGHRCVTVDAHSGQLTCPIYQRAQLEPDMVLQGPAIVEEMSATLFVGNGDSVRVDRLMNLVIDIAQTR